MIVSEALVNFGVFKPSKNIRYDATTSKQHVEDHTFRFDSHKRSTLLSDRDDSFAEHIYNKLSTPLGIVLELKTFKQTWL